MNNLKLFYVLHFLHVLGNVCIRVCEHVCVCLQVCVSTCACVSISMCVCVSVRVWEVSVGVWAVYVCECA